MNIFHIMSLFSLALLVGCGGGGSDEGVSETLGETSLGTRSVPGYHLEVSTDLPQVAGTARTVTLRVTPDVGSSELEQIDAAIADGALPPTFTPGTQASGSAQTWVWQITLPEDLNGKRVVVRLQDLSGNVSFTGFTDFALAP